MFQVLKYILVLVIGIAMGAIPIYYMAETVNLQKHMEIANIYNVSNSLYKSSDLEGLGKTLEVGSEISRNQISKLLEELPWIECNEETLIAERTLIDFAKDKTGEIIEPLCPNK